MLFGRSRGKNGRVFFVDNVCKRESVRMREGGYKHIDKSFSLPHSLSYIHTGIRTAMLRIYIGE